MIDYEFYRKIGDEGIDKLYHPDRSHPDDLLDLVEKTRSDLPYVDQIETTNNCNLRCRMCPRTQLMTREVVMSMRQDLFERIIDELEEIEQEKRNRGISKQDFLQNPPRDLVWHGSEFDISDLRLHHFGAPLLDPQIVDRVAYIDQNASFGAQLSETVINVKPEKALALFRHHLGRLIIAIDGTNAEEFERNRGRRINFEREVQKISQIIAMKREGNYSTALHIQLIKLADASTQRFVDMWGGQEGVEILHKPFFPYPDIDQSLGTSEDGVFDGKCKIPLTSVTVLADGRVVPCNSDYNGEEILGDLNQQSLVEVWGSVCFREFREQFIRGIFEKESLCNRCGYYPFRASSPKKLPLFHEHS